MGGGEGGNVERGTRRGVADDADDIDVVVELVVLFARTYEEGRRATSEQTRSSASYTGARWTGDRSWCKRRIFIRRNLA